MLGRRTFCQTLALATAGAALGGRGLAAAAPRLKIGCTGLIWAAAPKTPENLPQAIIDMDSLGFHSLRNLGLGAAGQR